MIPNRCRIAVLILFLFASAAANAREYHVSVSGDDTHAGTLDAPFRTIAHAAALAMPGDTVTVHAGIYRELVQPARGGASEKQRIVYSAAAGEKVEIRGSEPLAGWLPVGKGIWKRVIPDAFFKGYNPYTDLITGDWYFGSNLHTGEIFINGKPLHEMDSVQKLVDGKRAEEPVGVDSTHNLDGSWSWCTTHDGEQTTLYAQFHTLDPNQQLVEIAMRPACFYPATTHCNYITVSGFEMSQAATQWAAPTAEQVGLLGTNWSKGWIIEHNIIHDSKCVGITLGKDRKTGNNGVDYNEMVHRVIASGWNRDTIGSHLVRKNSIYNCGAAGLCGSFGAAYSQILDNHVYDIYTYRPYWGAEMGGIKIHGAIDVLIKGNRVHNTYQGIWLDWMAQGTRVTGNLLYENDYVDFFPEVDHGPYLVDNNFLLSNMSIKDWSEGGAYVHNLIAGMISRTPEGRETPYFKPHTTQFVAIKDIKGGDNRFFNNIFLGKGGNPFFTNTKYMPGNGVDASSGYGLSMYDSAALPMKAAGNRYLNGAQPFKGERYRPKGDTVWAGHWTISADGVLYDAGRRGKRRASASIVTSKELGAALIPGQQFEQPDGSVLVIDEDYFGKKRAKRRCLAGPLEEEVPAEKPVTLWPVR